MNYISDLENIPYLCRTCLTRSKNMISLNNRLEQSKEKPSIIEALEGILGEKVIWQNRYPTVICPMCLGLLKISYDFRSQLKNSEEILMQHFKDILVDPLSLNDSANKNHETNTESLTDSPSSVDIIVGSNKYSLKDVLIVEEEKPDQECFKGFLNNLGKTVSVKFVNNSKTVSKNLHLEEPVVLIDKKETQMQTEAIPKVKMKPSTQFVDQYILTQDNNYHFTQNSYVNTKKKLKKLGLENLTDIDQELLQSALNMRLRCSICDKLYSSKGRFKKHLESCEKLQRNINKSENEIPTITSSLKCHLCPRTFRQKKFLNYHIKTVHNPDPLKYRCNICDEVLRNKNSLNYHTLTKHGERKFLCDLCNKKFFTSNCLKTHILNHTEKRVAQCVCPVCGKTFHYKSGLFYHMKLHTNERKYRCEFCEKNFYTLNAKKRHTLTHTGIRPYACKYCEKHFFSTGELRKHEYLHTGVRPYHCQYCKKGFSSSYNLKVHLVSHAGPYGCKICDKTFVTMNVLQFHHRTKHSLTEEEKVH